MYLPQHFEETRPAVLHRLLQAHPLGLLITLDGDGTPVANPIPLMLDAARGPLGTLCGHVARANPVWHAAGQQVLVVFQGPDGYISPNGYAAKQEHGKVVPTWNYATVQGRGPLVVLDEATAAHALVSRLTDRHEAAQPRPWAVGDAPDDYIAGMLRAIVCIEIPLVSLVGKYKLSQNRSAADRAGVVAALQAQGDAPARQLADWMQDPSGGGGMSGGQVNPSLRLGPLRPQDRAAWEPLARGYKAFYETDVDDAGYDAAWQRLMAGGAMVGLGAWLPAQDAGQPERLVGIAHALFHASTWADTQCYLQDLFTADDVRGQGVAGALIAHLAMLSHARGADRLHWLTHHTNARARRLYDRVAVHKGFIRYDHPMPP